jgi:hypothetical protein
MSYIPWATTVLGFPIGGWIAALIVGAPNNILSASLAALIAGTVVGVAQWAAISRHVSWRWAAATGVGFTVGAAVSFSLFHGSIALLDLTLTGVLTGTLVGLGQGLAALHRKWRAVLAWTVMTGMSWGVGWAVSLMIITSNASSYIVFGLSGAALVTVLTGITLRCILGSNKPATRATLAAGEPASAVR